MGPGVTSTTLISRHCSACWLLISINQRPALTAWVEGAQEVVVLVVSGHI